MIEVTDEMITAANESLSISGHDRIELYAMQAAITAVLAIVARDYQITCGAAGPDGERCARPPRHDEHHAFAGALGLVMW